MYCSACGGAVAQGLSYCNHCGAKLNRGDSLTEASAVKPDMLVTSIVVTFIFGLALITILMGVMKAVLGLPVEQVLAIALVPILLMLILEGVFIRLLLRSRPSGEEASYPALSTEHATNELDGSQARALPEAMASVTEHTTRAFEPAYRDRK